AGISVNHSWAVDAESVLAAKTRAEAIVRNATMSIDTEAERRLGALLLFGLLCALHLLRCSLGVLFLLRGCGLCFLLGRLCFLFLLRGCGLCFLLGRLCFLFLLRGCGLCFLLGRLCFLCLLRRLGLFFLLWGLRLLFLLSGL